MEEVRIVFGHFEKACSSLIHGRSGLPTTCTEINSFHSLFSAWVGISPCLQGKIKLDTLRRTSEPLSGDSNVGLPPPNLVFFSPATLRESLVLTLGWDSEESVQRVGIWSGRRRGHPLLIASHIH